MNKESLTPSFVGPVVDKELDKENRKKTSKMYYTSINKILEYDQDRKGAR